MSILTEYLKKLINEEGFRDILLPKNLFLSYKNNRVPDELTIAQLAMANIDKNPDSFIEVAKKNFTDLRLYGIWIRGIRKFPSIYKIDKSDNATKRKILYGLEFYKDTKNTPISKVILGYNGVGKSSVYVALERCCIGNVYSAEYRGYLNPEQQIDYLKNISVKEDEHYCLMPTPKGYKRINIDNDAGFIPYPSGFCMENDIEELSKDLKDSYLALQLGIFDFYDCLKKFKSLKESYNSNKIIYEKCVEDHKKFSLDLEIFESLRHKENSELSEIISLAKEYDNILTKSLDYWTANIDNLRKDFLLIWKLVFRDEPISKLLSVFEKIEIRISDNSIQTSAALAACLKFLSTSITDSYIRTQDGKIFQIAERRTIIKRKIDETQELLLKTQQTAPLCGIKDPEYKGFIKLYDALTSKYEETLCNVLKNGNIVFPILMKEYFKKDIKDVSLKLDKDNGNIAIEIEAKDPVTGNSLGNINPRKYLNTFRFKIYCVALKISLAFTCAKLYETNAPIVIDDVFDSSDFSNRAIIKRFIKHIFDAHRKIFDENQKLQMIFFTQDDVIADSVYKGIFETEGFQNVEYSRIFDYMEADENDESPDSYKISESKNEEILKIKIDQKIR